MSDREILDEVDENNDELDELRRIRPSRSLSRWDKGVAIAGAGATLAGMVLLGPLTLPGLVIGGAGLAIIGVDMARKVGQLRGAQEIATRIDYLTMRNAALKNTLQRRHPHIPPP